MSDVEMTDADALAYQMSSLSMQPSYLPAAAIQANASRSSAQTSGTPPRATNSEETPRKRRIFKDSRHKQPGVKTTATGKPRVIMNRVEKAKKPDKSDAKRSSDVVMGNSLEEMLMMEKKKENKIKKKEKEKKEKEKKEKEKEKKEKGSDASHSGAFGASLETDDPPPPKTSRSVRVLSRLTHQDRLSGESSKTTRARNEGRQAERRLRRGDFERLRRDGCSHSS